MGMPWFGLSQSRGDSVRCGELGSPGALCGKKGQAAVGSLVSGVSFSPVRFHTSVKGVFLSAATMETLRLCSDDPMPFRAADLDTQGLYLLAGLPCDSLKHRWDPLQASKL